jgi:DNA-binding response OmpR family regulator
MKKILLVNSSRHFFDEGKSLLDRKDFQVLLAPSAVQALQIHREEHVNLVVSDLDMPEMGGDVLCVRIREEAEDRAVSFILICNDSPSEIERASSCGANVFLKKPFKAKTILEHVEKLLAISIRRGYRVLLRAKVIGSKDDSVFFCTSQNLSATGLLIETDRHIKPGDQITCSFYLPGSSHITAEGEVVRIESLPEGKHKCGIRFVTLSPEYQHAVEQFISESETLAH